VVARETVPTSLRAQYGTDKSYNGFHGTDANKHVEREIDAIFGRRTRIVKKILSTPPTGKQPPKNVGSRVDTWNKAFKKPSTPPTTAKTIPSSPARKSSVVPSGMSRLEQLAAPRRPVDVQKPPTALKRQSVTTATARRASTIKPEALPTMNATRRASVLTRETATPSPTKKANGSRPSTGSKE
jgi:hypothetical protein